MYYDLILIFIKKIHKLKQSVAGNKIHVWNNYAWKIDQKLPIVGVRRIPI